MSNVVAQKHEFYTQGYNILRNAVDPDAVKEALRWINYRLGEEGMIPGGSCCLTSELIRARIAAPHAVSVRNAAQRERSLTSGRAHPWGS